MDTDFPPPGPIGRLDRLRLWMQVSTWRKVLVLGGGALLTWIVLFTAWIGTAILRGSTDRDAGAVALNLVLVFFLAIVCLIATHSGVYRWFWHLDRKRAAGASPSENSDLRYGSEATEPPPRIDWPWALRLRHALIYIVGIATLLYAFAPYKNQRAISGFLVAHSLGSSSAGSLNMLLFGYLPMAILTMLAMLLTYRQMRRRDAGLLDAREKLLLDAEISWLFSFASALTTTIVLCRLAGGMIVGSL